MYSQWRFVISTETQLYHNYIMQKKKTCWDFQYTPLTTLFAVEKNGKTSCPEKFYGSESFSLINVVYIVFKDATGRRVLACFNSLLLLVFKAISTKLQIHMLLGVETNTNPFFASNKNSKKRWEGETARCFCHKEEHPTETYPSKPQFKLQSYPFHFKAFSPNRYIQIYKRWCSTLNLLIMASHSCCNCCSSCLIISRPSTDVLFMVFSPQDWAVWINNCPSSFITVNSCRTQNYHWTTKFLTFIPKHSIQGHKNDFIWVFLQNAHSYVSVFGKNVPGFEPWTFNLHCWYYQLSYCGHLILQLIHLQAHKAVLKILNKIMVTEMMVTS